MKLETENVKNDGNPRKIDAVLLNIKINQPKWVNMCADINWQHTDKISRKCT